jgi:hypothetical protein
VPTFGYLLSSDKNWRKSKIPRLNQTVSIWILLQVYFFNILQKTNARTGRPGIWLIIWIKLNISSAPKFASDLRQVGGFLLFPQPIKSNAKIKLKYYWKWQLDFQLPVQTVPITTNVVSLNPVHGQVYSIQHYVIKFVSNLQQVSGFLWVLRFPPPIKLTEHPSAVVYSFLPSWQSTTKPVPTN